MKRIICKCFILMMLAGALAVFLPTENAVKAANTSGTFDERISQLKKKFPAGKYWNHMGSSQNNPNGYTSTPCTHHGGCSRNGYNGWCGCNSFNNQSIQCFGFAEKLAYDVFGTNPSRTWTKSYSLSNVRAGDIIRYKNNGHSIFVTNVSGNTITYADCNSDGHCKIRWGATISKSNVTGLSYVQHANNYNDVSQTSQSKPSNVVLSKNQYWYDIKDTIVLTPSANNASTYWICIQKDGKSVINTQINGSYRFSADKWGYGSYYAWISAVNSAGYTDSAGITFSVVGKASYSSVSTTKKQYSIDENVHINVATLCAKGQVIGIDKEGTGRVITQDCSANYSIPASKLGAGSYSAYFSVYNGSGTTDTYRVWFSIYNSKPKTSEVAIDKSNYSKGEEITFKFKSDVATNYALGIDDANGKRIQTFDTTDNKYTRTFDKCGDYSCYVTSWNKYGYCDSSRIYFSIDSHQYSSKVTKEANCMEEGVRTYTCSSCGKTYTEKIAKTGHQYEEKVVAPTAAEQGYTLHTCRGCGDSYKDTYVDRLSEISKCKVSGVKLLYTYTGKEIRPAVIVKNGKETLSDKKDYTVTYKNNIRSGQASVIVKGEGRYRGSITKKFLILPKKLNLSSIVSQRAKQILVKWKKDGQASGYEVICAENRLFSKNKKVFNVSKKNITSKTIKGLKSGKKYYVKIRSYKMIDGEKCYGSYSAVKSVRCR